MKKKYSTNQLLEVLDGYKMAWYYKGGNDEDSYFGGKAYLVQTSSGVMEDDEVFGFVRGNEFISVDNQFSAVLDQKFEERDAVAIECIDGIVVVPKWSVYYRGKRRIEGYWYADYCPEYPMPVANQLTKEEAQQIYDLIKEKEKTAVQILARGFAKSRIDNTVVGTAEFTTEYWLWPEGFAEHYVLKHKVKPSDAFLAFIGWNPIKT